MRDLTGRQTRPACTIGWIRGLALGFLAAALLLVIALGGAAKIVRADEEGLAGPLHAAPTASVVIEEGRTLSHGHHAPRLRVLVRNNEPGRGVRPASIVLRDVHWEGCPPTHPPWRGPLFGVDSEGEDGVINVLSGEAVAHTADKPPMTSKAFEQGCLLPGGEMEIDLPLTPQADGKHAIVVRFVELEIASSDDEDVLLPSMASRLELQFAPRRVWEDRAALKGPPGLAYVPDALLGHDKEELREVVVPIQLQMSQVPERGLLSAAAARTAVGDRPVDTSPHAYFVKPLDAWFFISGNGSAFAVRAVPDERGALDPHAPEPGYRWEKVKLPLMDLTAPELLSRAAQQKTSIVRDPGVGRTLLQSPTAPPADWETQVATLSPRELWEALATAQTARQAVRIAAVAANPLTWERVLVLVPRD